jgi:DNA-binding transcriptional MerR regulator
MLRVDRDKVRGWAIEHAEYMSAAANPSKGKTRRFSDEDLRVLALVASQINNGAEIDDIRPLLDDGGQNEDPWLKWSLIHSPLFQDDAPDEIDETWYGTIIGGMASRSKHADVALAYWKAAKELLKRARREYEPNELDFPILFLVRHCLEIYLKAMLKKPPEHHDLEKLSLLVEKERGNRLADGVIDRVHDFHQIDIKSSMFRYGSWAPGEYWVDFHHLSVVMEELTGAFEKALRRR